MARENRYVKDMTEGTPYKLLLQFAVALFVGNIFQQLYNMVDSVVVGNFVSQNALGSIGTTNSVTFFFFSLVSGMAAGNGIITAQFFGSGDEKKVKDTIGNAIWIITITSAIMGCIAFFLARPVLTFLDTDAILLEDAVAYLKTVALGVVFTGLYNGVAGILRALGDSKTPLAFLIFACLLNIVLDLVFVLCFGWGVVGVATATAIAQLTAAATCIVYAYKSNTYFRLSRENLKLDKELALKNIRLGVPIGLQNSLIAISLVALQKVVNGFGGKFTTSFAIVSRIEQLVQQPFMSLGSALSTYVGQNIGAGKYKRVTKGFNSASYMTLGVAFGVAFIFWIFGKYIVMIFGDAPEIAQVAVNGLRITSCFYPFLGMIYPTRNVLNGAGDAKFSLYTGIMECIGRIAFAYPLTLIPFMGKYGVFYATGLTWFLNASFSFIRYKRGKWKSIRMVKNEE